MVLQLFRITVKFC